MKPIAYYFNRIAHPFNRVCSNYGKNCIFSDSNDLGDPCFNRGWFNDGTMCKSYPLNRIPNKKLIISAGFLGKWLRLNKLEELDVGDYPFYDQKRKEWFFARKKTLIEKTLDRFEHVDEEC